MNKKVLSLAILLGISMCFSSCGIYSFKGITATGKITIREFYNNADLGPANMGQNFTNEIKNYFIQNSNISVTPENGNLELEGEITGYTLTPIAPTSTGDPNEINYASQTRLTITVKATYLNHDDETMSFENKTFSFFKEFSNDEDFTQLEESLIDQIFERIILDIFNASVANW